MQNHLFRWPQHCNGDLCLRYQWLERLRKNSIMILKWCVGISERSQNISEKVDRSLIHCWHSYFFPETVWLVFRECQIEKNKNK